jgi:uncharacterized protein (TIGR00255 family)
MTGYAMVHGAVAGDPSATAESPDSAPQLGVELRSVNSRFLDLSFKLADDLRPAEPALRELIGQGLKRGKVELRAWVEGRSSSNSLAPSAAALQRLCAAQAAVLQAMPSAQPLSVAEALQWGQQRDTDTSAWTVALQGFAAEALQQLLASRQREGQRLADTLLERTAQLRQLARTAQPLIPQLVEQQRLRFLERWNEALGQTDVAADSARERALTEATAFAIRIDVAEELTRLHAHLDEIDRLLRTGSEMGKRLDFIIQELHREANTLGSKSSSLELTRISVDMKVLIEQMREQVQNLE